MSTGTYWTSPVTFAGYDALAAEPGPSPRTADGLAVASWGRRALARVVDGALALAVLVLAWTAMVGVSLACTELARTTGQAQVVDAGAVVNVLLFVAGAAGPPVLFEVWCIKRWGASPGKLLLGLRVRRYSGPRPLSVGIVLGRFAVWAGLWLLPFGRLVDYLWPLWDGRGQALHDKVGTAVVRVDRRRLGPVSDASGAGG